MPVSVLALRHCTGAFVAPNLPALSKHHRKRKRGKCFKYASADSFLGRPSLTARILYRTTHHAISAQPATKDKTRGVGKNVSRDTDGYYSGWGG